MLTGVMIMRRGRLVAASVLCLGTLTLSACNGGDEAIPNVPASPARTLVTPSATEATPTEKPTQKTVRSEVKGSPNRKALDAVVAQARQSLTSMISPAMKKVYSKIDIQPDYPNGVTYTYTFRKKLPAAAAAGIDGQSSTFQGIFSSTIGPSLKSTGIDNPKATFIFTNPDGSVIWSHTFTG